jgi:hypothetical protein
MSNVTIEDIKNIGIEYGILLGNEQLNNILREYNKVVMDKAGDWNDIVKELFVKEITRD